MPKSQKKEKQQKAAQVEKTPKAGDSTKEDPPAEKENWIPPAVFKLLMDEQKCLIKEGKKELVAQSLSSLADGINTWASQAKGKTVCIQGDPMGEMNKSDGNSGGEGDSTKETRTVVRSANMETRARGQG